MTSKRKLKTLTSNQIGWLKQITEEGIGKNALLALKGNAKNFAASYNRSLQSAIEAHNNGTAHNSPLPTTARIATGPFGERGGHGYMLVHDPFEKIVGEAAKLMEDEEKRHAG